MYSSLGKIDITASGPTGPLYVQTDHRTEDEIAAEPEISTLFALTRILLARAHGAAQPGPAPTIVYASSGEVPDFLVEVLAAAGARLTAGGAKEHRELAAVEVAPATLADRAFTALAARVQRRVDRADPAAALEALEAETLDDPPDVEDDEATYWTRVLELAAVVAEVVRAHRGGRWIESKGADIPFGFDCPDAGVILPTNRAQLHRGRRAGVDVVPAREPRRRQDPRARARAAPEPAPRGRRDARGHARASPARERDRPRDPGDRVRHGHAHRVRTARGVAHRRSRRAARQGDRQPREPDRRDRGAAITEKEATTSRRISKAILLVSEGAVVGHARLEPSEPPKKPGLFRRLFGK